MSVIVGIKSLMAEQGMTQADLSDVSGVSKTTLSLVLSGKVKPQVKTIAKIARALGSTYSALLKIGA